MAPLAELVKFSDFCELLRRLKDVTSLKKATQSSDRKREFEKFFKQWKSDDSFQNEELLPFLRIIVSDLDPDRRFDIGDKKLSQRVGKLLGVPSNKLVCFDSMGKHRSVQKLAEEVVDRIKKKPEDLTVATVSDALDRMANRELRDQDDSDFQHLILHCGKEELIWIFNILIRNVESYIGASSSSLLSLFGVDAIHRWTHSRTLSAVLEDFSSHSTVLGRNFRPMLLARLPRLADWWQPIAANSGKQFYVEMKYDGEHVLLHKMDKDNYKYFTRNGKDFSADYGASSKDGSISNRIHSFFLDSCVDCVLDCELVLYDKGAKKICRHNTPASDGQTYSFRNIPEWKGVVIIAVVLFDVLYYNGRSLLNVPLEERIKVLEKGVLKKEAEDTIYIAKRQIMSSRCEVEEFFAEAMKNNEEGIVVKSMTGPYIPGSRAQINGWYKLKPNLASANSLDLAIVAILPRQGLNGKDKYLLAAKATDDGSSKLVIVGSVSMGLEDLDRMKIYEDAIRGGPLSAEPHESIQGYRPEGKGGFVHPHHMTVVEVTCNSVRGRKLVDPVMRCIREKPLDEIDSVEHFDELAEVLRQCRLPDEEEAKRMEEAEERKRKKGNEGVIPTKREKKEESEGTEGSPLTGRTVCVLQGVDSKLRERAFKILDRFGAKNVANPVSGTDLVVAITRAHPRTRMVTGKNQWTVVDVQWLTRCEEMGRIEKWTGEELIHSVPGAFEIE